MFRFLLARLRAIPLTQQSNCSGRIKIIILSQLIAPIMNYFLVANRANCRLLLARSLLLQDPASAPAASIELPSLQSEVSRWRLLSGPPAASSWPSRVAVCWPAPCSPWGTTWHQSRSLQILCDCCQVLPTLLHCLSGGSCSAHWVLLGQLRGLSCSPLALCSDSPCPLTQPRGGRGDIPVLQCNNL